MGLWSKIKDALEIWKRDGELIIELGEVKKREEYPSSKPTYSTEVEVESGILLESNEIPDYYRFREGDKVKVSYWNKVDSKGKIRDFEVNEIDKV